MHRCISRTVLNDLTVEHLATSPEFDLYSTHVDRPPVFTLLRAQTGVEVTVAVLIDMFLADTFVEDAVEM